MRRWLAVVLALAGCGETAAQVPAAVDASVVVPDEPDAAPDAAHGDCPDAGTSDTCVPIARDDGGFRYGCYGGVCPVGDAGSCTVVRNEPDTTRYAEVVCERPACTRAAAPGDVQCGGRKAWQCPRVGASDLAVAPGRCSVWVAPGPGATGVMYCCD